MTKFLRETRLIFGRCLTNSLRNSVWLVMGLFQPLLYLLLFAPLLDNLSMPGMGTGSALKGFVPGLLVLTGMYSAAFVGFGVIEDLRSGVIERLRVTPASRLALLLGMVLRDVLVLIVQCALLLIVAVLMGLRIEPLAILPIFALLTLVGTMMTSLSYALALIFKSEDALAATLNAVMLPLTLLSGVLLPLTLAPQLLKTLAGLNPFSYAVDTSRALVNGQLGDSAILLGFAIMIALAVLASLWASRVFRQATA